MKQSSNVTEKSSLSVQLFHKNDARRHCSVTKNGTLAILWSAGWKVCSHKMSKEVRLLILSFQGILLRGLRSLISIP